MLNNKHTAIWSIFLNILSKAYKYTEAYIVSLYYIEIKKIMPSRNLEHFLQLNRSMTVDYI